MIPIKLNIKGITVFDELEIDFTRVNGDVVAICGPNGSGKTTMLESIFAAIYRQFPSRPAGIYNYCRDKDSEISFHFDWHGEAFRSLIHLNAKARAMESFLFDDQSKPCAGITGKNAAFDDLVERTFGRSGLILASVFCSQNRRGNFLEIPKIERKQLFLKMLDAETLQRISLAASKRQDAIVRELDLLRQTAQDLEVRAKREVPDCAGLQDDLEKTQASILHLEAEQGDLRSRMADRKTQLSAATMLESQAKPISERVKRLTSSIDANRKKIDQYKQLLGMESSIRDVAKKIEVIDQQLEEGRGQVTALYSERHELSTAQDVYKQAVSELRDQMHEIKSTIIGQTAALVTYRQAACTIDKVPCKAEGEFASCQFLIRAVEGREKIPECEIEVDNMTQSALKIEDQVRDLPAPNMQILTSLEARIKNATETVKRLEADRRSLVPTADKIGQLQEAQATVRQLAAQNENLTEDLATSQETLTRLRLEWKAAHDAATGLQSDEEALALNMKRVTTLRGQEGDIRREITLAEAVAKEVEEATDKLVPIKVDIEKKEFDRRSFDLLGRAFGPMGIQSLEIDAAGPAVSSLANDLLFSCFGPRFSIKFVTQVLKQDGGYKDEFDVEVYDSERNRSGPVDDLSGGERTILSEAISLSVALFNRQRSGISWDTLFRDEVSGALDDENAPRYIAMLRKAAAMGAFKRVYFIAHQSRLRELADSRIMVCDGRVEIFS
jgi:DNA repair protein SbcC/Rad50